MGKKKHVAVKSSGEDEENKEFSLEEVLKLGGEKKDYEWLLDLGDGDEVEDKEDPSAEPINRDELRDFVKQLGFYKLKDKQKRNEIIPSEGMKLAKRPLTDEEKQEEQELTTKSKKDKKKTKNKYKLQDEEISSTTVKAEEAARLTIPVSGPRKNLLIKLGGKWFNHQFSDDSDDFDNPPSSVVNRLQANASQLLMAEVAIYKKQQEKIRSSDANWMRTVLTSGTLGDKMAALTLLIQDAPVHNLASLETLIGMMGKKGRREALMATDTLKELFMNDLLLDDRQLNTFEQHPLTELDQLTSGNKDSRDRRLIMWYYEAQLKEKYSQFVAELEKLAQDNIAETKRKVLSTVHELLANKPEQEKKLLALLVNKLGDPDHKIASKSSYLLTKLVERHPNMKLVVMLEVERLLYRPNVSPKAQYYGVCFLHSLYLSSEDKDLAARLVSLYFTFFQTYVKKGDVDSKMLRALLTGVNRAYPFAKVDREKMTDQMDTLYRVVHLVNFNTGLQALMLLFQVMEIEDSTADRFYMALYRKLADSELQNSAHQPIFLNLLFKALRKDTVERRIKAFVKRLLQVCCYMTPTFVCGALILISELTKSKRNILQLSRSASLAAIQAESDEDEDEHFVDAPEDDLDSQDAEGQSSGEEEVELATKHKGHTTVPSWVHRSNLAKGRGGGCVYDAHHRNPLHCHADTECLWEIKRLAQHFHPSVALFASCLLKGEHIFYSGNPLQDFTLARFLDRFVYRNPKKITKGQESSSEHRAYRRAYNPEGLRALPVNSDQYLLSGRENIPADELFFFQYFTQHANRKQAQHEDMDSDVDSVEDEEFEEFLNRYEGGMEDKDVDLDFAGEFSKTSVKGKKLPKDDPSEEDDDLDLSDEEIELDPDDALRMEFEREMAESGDEQEKNLDEGEDDLEDEAGFNEEDVEFSEEDEPLTRKKKHKFDEETFDEDDFVEPTPKRKKKHRKEDLASLFASADEFAHLLDETGESYYDVGGSGAVAVKDKADLKQLQWEEKREKKFQKKGFKGKGQKRAPKHKGGFKSKQKQRRK